MNSVLVIDDEPKNIFALVAVLKSRKITCITASSGDEGLSLLREKHNIGVILMDIMMPEMDGYETIAKIRSMPGLKELPIIAVTAQAMVGDREKCLAAGANGYISKPIDIESLISAIHKYILV